MEITAVLPVLPVLLGGADALGVEQLTPISRITHIYDVIEHTQ